MYRLSNWRLLVQYPISHQTYQDVVIILVTYQELSYTYNVENKQGIVKAGKGFREFLRFPTLSLVANLNWSWFCRTNPFPSEIRLGWPDGLPETSICSLLTDNHEDEGANDHEDSLHKVSPHDGGESTSDGEKSRDCQEEEDAEVQPLGRGLVQSKLNEQCASVQISLLGHVDYVRLVLAKDSFYQIVLPSTDCWSVPFYSRCGLDSERHT